MGQIASRIFSSAVREVKMFNIEKRAEKVISQEKPTPAPLHPAAKKELERLKAENISMDYIYNKDGNLDENLKKVYVTSPDPAPPLKMLENPLRPLPQSRHRSSGLTYGYSQEEERISEGKVSLKQALQFIADHATDPKAYTSSAICKSYKLDPKVTDNILEHFKMFNITFKKKGVDPETLQESENLQKRMQAMNFVNAYELLQELKPHKRSIFKDSSSSEEKTNTDQKSNKKDDSERR